MLIRIAKKIPFIILILAFINIVGVKIIEYIDSIGYSKQAVRITRFIFDPKTPFYFNYWPVYIFCAIIISIVFALLRKYRALEAAIVIGVNVILFIVMFIFIMNRM